MSKDQVDEKLLMQYKLDQAARELEVSKAFDEAIRLGKEITLMLEDHKPVTKCLVGYILNKEYTRRFPKIIEHFDQAGIGNI